MTLAYAEPEPLSSSRNPYARLFFGALRYGSVGFLAFVAIGIIGGISVALAGPPGGFYIFIVGVIAFRAFAQMRRGLHRRRVAAVFGYCARAVRLNVPLDLFLHAAADAESGTLRLRLRRIARRVAEGQWLERALCDALPELDARQVRLIGGSTGANALVEELDRLAEEHAESSSHPGERDSSLFYYTICLLLIGAVLTMLQVFIVPKLHQIARDFRIPEQPSYIPDIAPVAFPVLAVLPVIAFGYVVASTRMLTRMRGTIGETSGAWPGFWSRWLFRSPHDRTLGDLYLSAARGIEAGQPLTQLDAPAVRAGLPLRDRRILEVAPPGAGRALTYRFLAGCHLRSTEARDRFVRNIASTCMTLLLAALVGLVIREIWPPMIRIMNHVDTVVPGRFR